MPSFSSPSPAPPSEALRRVMDALLDGLPPPADAQAALTEAEQAEVAGLVRTANLTRLTLQAASTPDGGNGESAALDKAQAALQSHAGSARPVLSSDQPAPWWAFWRKRNTQ